MTTTSPIQSAAVTPAHRTRYELDASHSEVAFSVRHMMVSSTRGRFGAFTGTLTLDERDPARSEVNVEIDAASIDTREPKRDEHLRSADFLDVERFPKLTFRSTKVERSGADYVVTGELTIKDVTRPVVLAVEAPSEEVKDPWGGIRRGTRASTKIRRDDFGLSWNVVLETGGILVGNEVRIDLEIELVKKA